MSGQIHSNLNVVVLAGKGLLRFRRVTASIKDPNKLKEA